MKLTPSPYPTDFSVQPPAKEQLDRITLSVYGSGNSFGTITPEKRSSVYRLALAEIQACALAHLAEFTGRLHS